VGQELYAFCRLAHCKITQVPALIVSLDSVTPTFVYGLVHFPPLMETAAGKRRGLVGRQDDDRR
jgi:hypothetical protein